MKVVRYPVKALVADYFRAGIGLSVGLGALVTVPPGPIVYLVFGGLSAIFGIFGYRTVRRHVTTISVGDTAISSRGLGGITLPWHDLEVLKLRYYGSRRQRARGEGEGFMQLTLRGAGASLTLESSVDGFEYIAWRAAKAARDNHVTLDQTSASNLLDIGIDADVEQPAPELGADDPT